MELAFVYQVAYHPATGLERFLIFVDEAVWWDAHHAVFAAGSVGSFPRGGLCSCGRATGHSRGTCQGGPLSPVGSILARSKARRIAEVAVPTRQPAPSEGAGGPVRPSVALSDMPAFDLERGRGGPVGRCRRPCFWQLSLPMRPPRRLLPPPSSTEWKGIGPIVAPMPEFLRKSAVFPRVRIPASRPNKHLQKPTYLKLTLAFS